MDSVVVCVFFSIPFHSIPFGSVLCCSLHVNAYTFNMLLFYLMVIFVGGDGGGGCFLSHYFATVFHTYAHI